MQKSLLTPRIGCYYYVSAAYESKMLISDTCALSHLQTWKKNSWTEFDDYSAFATHVRIVYFDRAHKNNWRGLLCLCKEFQKQHICEDVVAVASLENLYSIPEDWKV